jgi:hypothetical protein
MSVKLRYKRLKNGNKSLWLDIYAAGQRRSQYLEIVLDGNKENDKEKLKIAEFQRAKVEMQLLSLAAI